MNKIWFALFILLMNFTSLAAERSPYGGVPAQIPGVILAENYDHGGEGTAYHDIDPGNNGGFGRTAENVDVDADGDHMYVGWTQAGEWLAYTVDVQAAGYYWVEARVASEGEGGTFRASFDGVRHLEARFKAHDTGGWRQWRLVAGDTVFLSAGTHTMFIVMDTVGPSGSVANIDWIRFTPAIMSVPGTIEAERYSIGYDSDVDNNGRSYRNDQVDIDYFVDSSTLAPGYYIGWTQAGEALEYPVEVQTEGYYRIDIRVASDGNGGGFHIEFSDSNGGFVRAPQYGSKQPRDTGGWRRWTLLTEYRVYLRAGPQTMRIVMDFVGSSGSVGNIDWLRLVPDSQGPRTGVPLGITAGVEAENYDWGGEGVAYHDSDANNNGNLYRLEDVDIDREPYSPFDIYIGWTRAGEWLEYTVEVESDGLYRVEARVASAGQGGTFHIEFDGIDKTGPFAVPDSGGWRAWTVLSKSDVYLTAGVQVMRIAMDAIGPSGSVANIDRIQFVKTAP